MKTNMAGSYKVNPAKFEGRRLPTSLAKVVSAYAHNSAVIASIKFGEVSKIDGLTTLTTNNARVNVSDTGEATLTLEQYVDRHSVEGPVLLEFRDGTSLSAKHADVFSQRMSVSEGKPARETTVIQLADWQWSGKTDVVAWVGVLHGRTPRQASNLYIRADNRESYNSIRLQGRSTWHLVQEGVAGPDTRLAVIDVADSVERASLGIEFAALEFLFGGALRLDMLVGVNEQNDPVAAVGLSFGYRYRRGAHYAPPVPDEHDVTWAAVAFPLLVSAFRKSDPTPAALAAGAYVDSTMGHVDGQYLFAQVALEALADRLMPVRKPIVKDETKWKKWLKDQRPLLSEHAVDKQALQVLEKKLSDAAHPTTSQLVRRLLLQLGVTVPEEALNEVGGRNVVAHTLSMNKEGVSYDLERELRRRRRRSRKHRTVENQHKRDGRLGVPLTGMSVTAQAYRRVMRAQKSANARGSRGGLVWCGFSPSDSGVKQ